jgi:hypothetical protein
LSFWNSLLTYLSLNCSAKSLENLFKHVWFVVAEWLMIFYWLLDRSGLGWRGWSFPVNVCDKYRWHINFPLFPSFKVILGFIVTDMYERFEQYCNNSIYYSGFTLQTNQVMSWLTIVWLPIASSKINSPVKIFSQLLLILHSLFGWLMAFS